MAPVTSSSDRSKRQQRSKAVVRSDKGRQNRQSVSKAKTTNDSNRPRTGASSKITKGEQRKVTNTAKVTRSSTERPQLPPRGGSSATSPKASSQRGWTRDAQAKNALSTMAKGTMRTLRRMSAEGKQSKAAKGKGPSGNVQALQGRGELAKRPSSAITPASKTPAGKLATPAGKLATTGSSSTTDTRIQRANVRVLDSQQSRLPAGGQKALPPGRSGGAVSRPSQGRSGATTDGRIERVSVREAQQRRLPGGKDKPQMTGSQNARLPAGRPTRREIAQAKLDRAAKGTTGPNRVGQPGAARGALTGLRGGLVGAGVMAAGEAIFGPVARKTGEALGNALKRQADGKGADYMRQGDKQKANTGGVRRRVKADSMQDKMSRAQRNAQYRQASLERTNRIKASIPDARQAPTTNDGQTNRQSSQRRSSGSMMSTPQGRQSSTRASQAAPRTTTSGTGGQGRKWEDFNPGRGTSETTNPLIKKDSWLMGKLQQREDRMSQNVGPVADGTEYASSKKASEIVARRKKKEEEDKKKTQQ